MSREDVLYKDNGVRYLTKKQLEDVLPEVEGDPIVYISDGENFYPIQEIVQDEDGDVIIRAGEMI